MQQHIFQDISQIILLSGWNFPSTLFYLIATDCVSIVLALILIRRKLIGKSWVFYSTILLLGLIGLDYFYSQNLFLLEVFLGNCLISNLFVLSFKLGEIHIVGNHKRFLVLWGIGIMLYTLLVVLYYITFTPLIFIIIVTTLFILVIWFGIGRISIMGVDAGPKLHVNKWFLGILIVLVLSSPLRIAVEQSKKTILPIPTSSEKIQVLSINLHQGFDAFGNMAIYEQAQIIKASDADIISMNEVNRGWLLDGSLDMYVWLSHELNMFSSYGLAMGHLSGNAIFSRFPLEYSTNSLYLNDTSRIPRAYLHAVISLGDDRLNVVSTHLAWDDGGTTARDIEAHQLTEKFQRPGTLILGDMNAFPDSNTIRIFTDAGFIDAFTTTGQGIGYTWHALEPVYRIDYIFGSKDVHFEDFKIIDTTVSDHLPILVAILP